MPSITPSLITYLVGKFQGDATLGQATPPVTVYDGPPTTGLDAPLKLYVGLTDPDNEAAEEAAVFDQVRPDLGSAQRDETVSVRCCAEAWGGSDDIAAIRTAVFGITAAVENLVRADNAFGGLAGTRLAAPGVSGATLLQNNTSTGAVAQIRFSIDVRSIS